MNVADIDSRLVARTLAGDGRAFEELVRRHLKAASAVALGVLGDPADAEDVCQEAFLAALTRLEECRDPSRFSAWLLAIVRNRALNARERRAVRESEPLTRVAHAAGEDDPAENALRSERKEKLLAALSGLPPAQREVVLLHDLEGWRHREIADLLGTSEGAVRVRLLQARRNLRARLSDSREG